MIKLTFLARLRSEKRISERELSLRAGISRMTLRNAEKGVQNLTIQSLQSIARALDKEAHVLIYDEKNCRSSSSSIAISIKITDQGLSSWPYHLMEMVDDFRASKDPRLVLLPPSSSLDLRLKGLIASTVCSLCEEVGLPIPSWAGQSCFLPEPWFVSETESLKASALLESPFHFRKNNIFVQENFLKRA